MSKTSTKKNNQSLEEMNEKVDGGAEFLFEPKNSTINNILNYSKALSIRESKTMKWFEIVSN
ncbi:MAG: hypothetical protein ABI315_10625 [Bacteroidia bacterium]